MFSLWAIPSPAYITALAPVPTHILVISYVPTYTRISTSTLDRYIDKDLQRITKLYIKRPKTVKTFV